MNGVDLIRGLQFDNKPVLNKKIQSTFANRFALVRQMNRSLLYKLNTSATQFNGKGLGIRYFKKPRPKNPMHFNRCSDDLAC